MLRVVSLATAPAPSSFTSTSCMTAEVQIALMGDVPSLSSHTRAASACVRL